MVFSNIAACNRTPTPYLALAVLVTTVFAGTAGASEPASEGVSTREAKMQAIQAVPLKQMSNQTAQALRDVLDNPSFYRRMPTQSIQCDPELFNFLVRKPEIMVNTWDLMGITKVTAKRTGPFTFLANDGVGTRCKCDLVYGDNNIHVYYGSGDYDGTMTPRSVKGRAVCILRSDSQVYPQGHSGHIVRGTMDVFLKLDNLGADLLTRTFGPLVAKTADHNFAETAQFVSQLSQVCSTNPSAALALAGQLNDVDDTVKQEFIALATRIGDAKAVSQHKARALDQEVEPRAMAQTLAELKVASTVPPMVAHRAETGVRGERFAETNQAKQSGLNEPAPIISLADDSSKRRGSSSDKVPSSQLAPLQPAPLSPVASPSTIYPRKANITMRR